MFAESIARHPSFIYNVLSKLLKRGQIKKDGDLYFLPSAANQDVANAKG